MSVIDIYKARRLQIQFDQSMVSKKQIYGLLEKIEIIYFSEANPSILLILHFSRQCLPYRLLSHCQSEAELGWTLI